MLLICSNVNALTIGAHEPRSHVAQVFAAGGERTKALRDSAWAAHRAAQEARDAGQAAASDATRGRPRGGCGVPPPLAKAIQVKHILGSAVHAARAFELSAGDGPAVGVDQVAQFRILAHPVVVEVLRRHRAHRLLVDVSGADSNTRRIAATTGDPIG